MLTTKNDCLNDSNSDNYNYGFNDGLNDEIDGYSSKYYKEDECFSDIKDEIKNVNEGVDELKIKDETQNNNIKYNLDCHPILYFLLILYNSFDDYYKEKEIYKLLKKFLINRGLISDNVDSKIELLDMNELIFRCVDILPEKLVNTAKIFTIKNCYQCDMKQIKKITIINSFVIYSLGCLIYNDKWYKYEYNRHGWKVTTEMEILQDINIFFASNLESLCRKIKLSLDGFTSYVSQYLCINILCPKDIERLNTILYLKDFNKKIDKKPILRFNDCVYDFRIKTIRPGKPSDFCVKGTGYNYYSTENNEENKKLVMNFFKDVFIEDELITYVLKLLASTLTLGNKLRSIIFFIGNGRNGKTALTTMLKYALGEYAASPNVSLFLGKSISSDKPNPHMMELNNARIALCEEPDAKTETITGDTKAITGNVGYLKSRTLYQELETIYVDLLPIINTNYKLTITNIDTALMDRIIVIPFLQRFTPSYNIDKEEPNVKIANSMWQGRNLEQFAPSLIHILLSYYQENYNELLPPEIVKKYTNDFILRCDHIGRFIKQKLVDENNDNILKLEDVYNTYKKWYRRYVSTSVLKYTITEFKLDLIKYKIRIRKGLPNDNISSPEDFFLIGYNFI